MKKNLLSGIVATMFTIATNAQIPNKGFENWTTTGAYSEPDGWATTNPLSSGPFYAATQNSDHYPANVGSYSIRLENNTSVSGYAGIGAAVTGNDIQQNGLIGLAGHPTSLTGWYKFLPQNGDTMTISVRFFFHGDGTEIDSLQTTFTTATTASNWTSFNLVFPNYVADSAVISLGALNMNGAGSFSGNSVLYVDNLNFDSLITGGGTTVINELYTNKNAITIYPNPTNKQITFSVQTNAQLTNVTGQIVANKKNVNSLDISKQPAGIYFVTLTDDSGQVLQRNRIVKK